MTTVAEEGNRRRGDMSRPELVQCVNDIKGYFMRTKCAGSIGQPASEAHLQRMNKRVGAPLPTSFTIMLEEVNGGMWFMEKEMLSSEKIMDVLEEADRSKRWKAGLIPFCGDEGCMLAIDTKENDEIVEWDADDGVGDVVAPNLCVFLENYRNSLLSGKFEFVDGVGVMEKVARNKK